MQFDAGIEIHVQLSTKTKAFSSSPARFGEKPNACASEIDMGFPGTLPVVNKEMLKQAIMLGKWLHADIAEMTTFVRKHYFYPDLPKGYQITQDESPILVGGYVDYELNSKEKRCHIHHAHLEEDAGKSVHGYQHGISGVDLNRAGQPLLEIVTEPNLHSIEEVVAFLKRLHSIVTYLEICDGNMQEGSFRADVNISLRKDKNAPLGTRVELKNMNSFKFIQKALEYEVSRQTAMIENSEPIVQETRLYNEAKNRTESMRDKESAHDYRYFREPDLPAIWINKEFIDNACEKLPASPFDRRLQYIEMGLSNTDANIIAFNRYMGNYFEALSKKHDVKIISNWLLGPISALSNKHQLTFKNLPLTINDISDILSALKDSSISSKMAKDIVIFMWEEGKSFKTVVAEKGFKQLDNEDELKEILHRILKASPKQLAEYRNGKEKLFGFFVGQAMKETKGQANPEMLNNLLKMLLSNSEK
jgi:aspartyl-tRNA(Asn)/glutamyl-tRNA(Gln) amidotransferase subunit B